MNVVNEAAFLAARQGADVVGIPQLLEAVDRTRCAALRCTAGTRGGWRPPQGMRACAVVPHCRARCPQVWLSGGAGLAVLFCRLSWMEAPGAAWIPCAMPRLMRGTLVTCTCTLTVTSIQGAASLRLKAWLGRRPHARLPGTRFTPEQHQP